MQGVCFIYPSAEQLYLLKVRSQLESPVGLTAALTQLDELLGLVQSITLRNRGDENLVRAGFLVNAIPQVRGIAPIIGGYLQSILAQIKYIDDHKDAVSVSPAGYFSRSVEVKKYSDLQNLQLRELRAREELAYAAFDAIFGRMAKPASVPAPALFTADYSPANEFAHKLHNLHATLPATRVSEKLIVKDDGSIAVIGSSDFITGIDLRSEFMTQACTATTAFKAKALGATKLVKDTFRSSALAGFADLVPAKASLTPAPVDLASASGDASAVSVTATVTTD